jgi:probable F420-dependent oxidoreductase
MHAQRSFRFGVVAGQARSGAEWIDIARRAEALGYSTLLIPDTLGPTLAPLPALAFAAAATETLRLGTFVLANDMRNPVLVARECATIDFLSGGRLELGLGAGRPTAGADHRKLGIPFDSGGTRVERLAEALTIIKALLSGQTTSAAGSHYTIDGADMFPHPIQQPHPPIMVAAGGRRLLALAAREADIVALAIQASEPLAAFEERVGWLRQQAGERFEQIELSQNLVAVGDQMPQWLVRSGLNLSQLAAAKSPAALIGTTDQMCEQLLERRERLGISYITVSAELMEALAPVVSRLRGMGDGG